MLAGAGELREQLAQNTRYFRQRMGAAEFELRPGVHPIVPVMVHDAPLAQRMAAELLDEGIYVVGFFYPVVPKGQAHPHADERGAHPAPTSIAPSTLVTRVGRRLGVLES